MESIQTGRHRHRRASQSLPPPALLLTNTAYKPKWSLHGSDEGQWFVRHNWLQQEDPHVSRRARMPQRAAPTAPTFATQSPGPHGECFVAAGCLASAHDTSQPWDGLLPHHLDSQRLPVRQPAQHPVQPRLERQAGGWAGCKAGSERAVGQAGGGACLRQQLTCGSSSQPGTPCS